MPTTTLVSWATLLTVVIAALLFYVVASWYDTIYTYFSYKAASKVLSTQVGGSSTIASVIPVGDPLPPNSSSQPLNPSAQPPNSSAQPPNPSPPNSSVPVQTIPTVPYVPSQTATPVTVPETTKRDVLNALYFALIWTALVIVIIVIIHFVYRSSVRPAPLPETNWGGHIVKPLDTLIRTEDITRDPALLAIRR